MGLGIRACTVGSYRFFGTGALEGSLAESGWFGPGSKVQNVGV